ncbi:hypothetical protein Tco_0339022, partial [Tanacetum coccineum]
VLLLWHGTSDSGPDISLDTSASLEYVSDLGCTSLAKVISYVSPSVVLGRLYLIKNDDDRLGTFSLLT